MRRLIVTADDLGADLEVNEAVVRACREGVLRHASLMVAEPAAPDAVRRVREGCPGLGVGLHLVLCAGRSVLGARELAGLVGPDGRFPDDPVRCGLRYFFDRSLLPALEAEMRAQFERFLELGLPPGHVDGHANIHAHPVLFPVLLRLVREYGFTRVRLPGGAELFPSLGFSRDGWAGRLVLACVFAWLRAYLLRAYGDPRIAVPERVYGLLRSGRMEEEYVLSLLEALPEGTAEFYLHPSTGSASAGEEGRPPTHRSLRDLEILLSPRVREAVRASGLLLES